MTDSTPPEDFELGQLNNETLDEVAPRLRDFSQALIERLRACDLKEVKTTFVHLLNSTDHPIEVPYSANGVEIKMNFDATLPVWAPDPLPRARLQVSFNEGKRFFYTELGSHRQFPMNKILAKFLKEILLGTKINRIQTEKLRKQNMARENLEAFRVKMGFPESLDQEVLRMDNIRVRSLQKTPMHAIVMLVVPYEEAAEIVQKYRRQGTEEPTE